MSKRDEYATKLKQTVDEFSEKIAELEVKAGQAQAEVVNKTYPSIIFGEFV